MIRLLMLMIGLIICSKCPAQPPPAFEVASVKRLPSGKAGLTSISPYGKGTFTATNISLKLLICLAFGVSDTQILGEPPWLSSERYDVNAKPEGDIRLTPEELKPRLKQLLQQRFNLGIHRQMQELQGYALVVGKGGPKLKAATSEITSGGVTYPGGLRNPNASMATIAGMLERPIGHPVVDQTGIDGRYDIVLSYTKDEAVDSSLPSVFTALQEQLGLKLIAQKVTVEMLVIDHVEKIPTEN